MSKRHKPLLHLDPRSVPLPHGTEVVLGVERLIAGKRVPQGALGRVVKGDDDSETVQIAVVGVGTGTYRRDEVSPRKEGQKRFAQRRAGAWADLFPCRILEATVGSRAWGLADDDSDVDKRGIFALPLPWSVGLGEPPLDLVSADGSQTYWELRKAVRQALRADPNTLELLFVPDARALDPIGEWILAEREAFVSAQIFGSFGQYAVAQLRRLEQSQRLAQHRASVLDWLREDPALGFDGVAERLARLTPERPDAHRRAREYVKQLYRSMYDQGLVDARDFSALIRFAQQEKADFELPRELRPKNAYNLIRLIATAEGWLRTGAPEFEVSGPVRERLLAIKRGAVRLEEVLAEAEAMTASLEAAFRRTKLPAHPDFARADALVRRAGLELARRWTSREPGPFGAEAPPPPGLEEESP